MKILHSADWHLDSPMEKGGTLQAQNLLSVPERIADLCEREHCDMMLLSGDLFDGPYSAESCRLVGRALERVKIPVCIAPGNHDFVGPDSPWERESWPENVHIFLNEQIEQLPFPELSCRVYGAGFTAASCPSLLDGFHAAGPELYKIGVFHGDPTQLRSSYNPVSHGQVENSGLDYLALGHIHKTGSFEAGHTLCAWPGCPMGRGYDELGDKGVLIAELGEQSCCRFVSLGFPCYEDLQISAGSDPAQALGQVLPSAGSSDYYRITFTGESEGVNIPELTRQFGQFPNLILRDRTVKPLDIWKHAGEDSFEGVYFSMLRDEQDSPETAALAARISRQILEGQEVELP